MRMMLWLLKWAGFAFLALLAAGAVYEQIGFALDSRLKPPASDMVLVHGRMVHLVCRGSGPVTFVLDAGAGAGTFEWWRLQPLLAISGRACAFDRPGLGWSDPSDQPHDGVAASDFLATLVRGAHISRPFVYVGHSLGANFAMTYYARHAKDVAALVLIEPGDPKDLLEDFHGTRADAMVASHCAWICNLATAASYLGIPRLAAAIMITGHQNLDGQPRSDYLAGLGRPSTVRTLAAEYIDDLPKTAFEDNDVKTFGRTPVLVFTSSAQRQPEGKETPTDVQRWREGQLSYLTQLAGQSSRGHGPVVVPNSTHTTMVMGETQAHFVAAAIRKILLNNGG